MNIDVMTSLILVFCILIMASMIPFSIWMMVMAGKQESILTREGMTTYAEVVNWEWQKSYIKVPGQPWSSPFAGYITYRYYVNTPSQARQLFTKSENVWVAMNWRHPVGSSIRVRYLPGDPNICQIAESILGLPQDQK